jgi:hypothetical protein
MKYVEFYHIVHNKYEKMGEVRLVDGVLEFTDELLRRTLEEIPVLIRGRYYWPWDDDKEKYLSLLPLAFGRGTAFRASLVLERDRPGRKADHLNCGVKSHSRPGFKPYETAQIQ